MRDVYSECYITERYVSSLPGVNIRTFRDFPVYRARQERILQFFLFFIFILATVMFYPEVCDYAVAGEFEELFDYGTRAMKAGEKERAISYLEAALRLKSDRTDIMFMLVELYDSLGKKAAAAEYLEKILRLDPSSSRARKLLAAMNKKERKVSDRARKLVEKAILLSDAGEHDRAVNLLGEAAAEEPSFFEAWYLLAREQTREGNITEASQAIARALALDGESVPALVLKAKLDFMGGRKTESVTLLKKALEIDPRSTEAAELLSRIESGRSGTGNAFEASSELIESHGKTIKKNSAENLTDTAGSNIMSLSAGEAVRRITKEQIGSIIANGYGDMAIEACNAALETETAIMNELEKLLDGYEEEIRVFKERVAYEVSQLDTHMLSELITLAGEKDSKKKILARLGVVEGENPEIDELLSGLKEKSDLIFRLILVHAKVWDTLISELTAATGNVLKTAEGLVGEIVALREARRALVARFGNEIPKLRQAADFTNARANELLSRARSLKSPEAILTALAAEQITDLLNKK